MSIIQTAVIAFSGSIVSTESGIWRNIKSLEKSESTQFTQLWMGINNDFKIPKNIFTECSKEQISYQYNFKKQWKL